MAREKTNQVYYQSINGTKMQEKPQMTWFMKAPLIPFKNNEKVFLSCQNLSDGKFDGMSQREKTFNV